MLWPAIPVVRGLVEGGWYYPEMLHISGVWAVRFLALSLAVTPILLLISRLGLGRAIGRSLLPRRKHFGLAAFVYASLHLAHYLREVLDLREIVDHMIRWDYGAGWVAFVIMGALAATSNRASQRRLGRRWKTLHRAVYAAAPMIFLHWWLFEVFIPLMWLWLWLMVAAKATHLGLRHAPAHLRLA